MRTIQSPHGFFATLLLLNLILPAGSSIAEEQIQPALIYHNYCSVCHGDKGDGDSRAMGSLFPPPVNFTTPQASTELSLPRMINSISEGRPGTGMAPWKHQLSQPEIESVAQYIRERFMMASTIDYDNLGRKVYADNCSVCHGDRGQSARWTRANLNPPPRDFTSETAIPELDRKRMIFSVTYGRPQTAMGSFGDQLSAKEIESVVDYIRRAFMGLDDNIEGISGTMAHGRKTETTAPKTDPNTQESPATDIKAFMSQPLPDDLKGDKVNGMALYIQNCVPCHGIKGDGQGPRAYFIFPKPRDFSHPAAKSSLNRPALHAAISKGSLRTEMPAWDKVLSSQEIGNISEYILQAFILEQKDH